MKTLVELREVTKRYSTITALDGVNLKVEAKEILTVVGPNGSGKTTLLRILASIDSPSSGEVLLEGREITDQNRSQVRRRSTLVFQKTALFSTTVYKNVAYGLRLRGYSSSEIDDKVEEALRLVGLEGYGGRPAKKLSGGEKQRVSLARALALRTDFLLLSCIDPQRHHRSQI